MLLLFGRYVVSDSFCSPVNYRLSGSFVHRIIQAKILEWVPLSSPGDRPYPGIEPMSPALAKGFFITEPPQIKILKQKIILDLHKN